MHSILPLLAFLAATGGAPEAPPPAVFEYRLSETRRTTTPRGRQTLALAGQVTVSDGRAKWTLETGEFPRSSANSVMTTPDGFFFLNTKTLASAQGTEADFDALFRPRSSEAGSPGSYKVQGLEVSVEKAGAGGPFMDGKTSRFRILARWVLTVSIPGRVMNIRSELKGTMDVAPGSEEMACKFDDPLRLLPVRDEPLERLRSELAKVSGIPVTVDLEFVSEHVSEHFLAPRSAEDTTFKMQTSVSVERRVRTLQKRVVKKEDRENLFKVSDPFKSLGLERLVFAEPQLP